MRKIRHLFTTLLTVFGLFWSINASAQYVVDFEGAGETKGAYASATVKLSGLDWNMTESLIGSDANDKINGERSARFRGYGVSSMTMLEGKEDGLGTISFNYRRYGTDGQVDWCVEYSTTGGDPWVQIGSDFTAPASDDLQLFSEDVNVQGTIFVRIKRATEAGSSNRRLNIDDIILTDYSASTPPAPTFFPEDNATNVAVDVNPTITFDKVIYAAGVEVDDTNVESLITFTDGTNNVDFSATITGRVITVVPDAELDYSTEYTLTIAKVEDAGGAEMDNDASVSFTTLADTDPVLNLTGALESIYYQGDNLTVTWQAKNIDKVKVEVWLPTDPAQWMELADEVDAADGTFTQGVDQNSPFSKAYKLRITGTTSGDPSVETPEFTIREVYTKLTDILGKGLNTEFRYDGEAVVTHTRNNRNQKYIQDDFGAMLIDDAGAVITSNYTIGSAITGLVAKVGDFNGLTQVIPLADPGAPVSEGNEVLPVEMALTDIGPEHQSMLVELSNITFESTGTFAGNNDYVIKDADGNTFAYRTVFTEADYIGTDIPTQRQSKLVGIVVKFHETMQFVARSLADFNAVTDASMQWDAQLSVYPNPFSHMLRIENVDNAMRVVVSNLLGQTVLNVELGGANQAEINTEALQSGVYLVTVINGNGERSVRRVVKR